MSGTRSPFPKERVTEALIVAHGQPSEPDAPEAALARLARQVGERLPGWRVRSATMAAPGRLEAQAAALAPGAVVYPFFMARGWFVGRVLPDRLGRGDLRIADPLGMAPGLPVLAAHMVREAGAPAGAPVLVAAHGSGRGRAAAEAALGFSQRLGEMLPENKVTTGFVEQSPTVAEAARTVAPGAVCLPFLAFPGGHYREDIPEALQNAGFDGVVLPVLGLDRRVPELVATTLERTAA